MEAGRTAVHGAHGGSFINSKDCDGQDIGGRGMGLSLDAGLLEALL